MTDMSHMTDKIDAASILGDGSILSVLKTRVIFIRHAQSQENVKYYSFLEAIHRIRSFRLPSLSQLSQSLQLLQCNLDSSLSELGYDQARELNVILENDNFWTNETIKPDVILHSPLVRTKQTLLGILSSSNADNTSKRSSFTSQSAKIMEVKSLREYYPHEYIINSSLLARQQEFKKFLAGLNVERVLVVGHGQYLRTLLCLKDSIRNCDVIEVDFDNRSQEFDETSIKTIYRIKLAEPLYAKNQQVHENNHPQVVSGEDVNLSEDEPMCRICQVK